MFISKSFKIAFVAGLAALVPGAHGYECDINVIDHFQIIDAKTNELLQYIPLSGGFGWTTLDYAAWGTNEVNIVAVPLCDITDSVMVTSDDPIQARCETRAPFSIFGDSPPGGADVSIEETAFSSATPGPGTITATPYTSDNCGSGDAMTAILTIEDVVEVEVCPISKFVLYSSITNDVVTDPLLDFFCGNVYAESELSIEAVVDPSCADTIESVKLELFDRDSGDRLHSRGENGAPYMLFGDSGGDIFPDVDNKLSWFPYVSYVREFTVKATPYTEDGLGGDAGETVSFDFDNSYCTRRLRGKE